MKSPVRFARVLLQHYNSGFYDFNSIVTSIINSSIASSTIPSSRTIAGFFALWSFQALVDLASLKTGARLEDFNLVFLQCQNKLLVNDCCIKRCFKKRRETHGQAEGQWGQSEIAFQLIEFNDSLSASPVVVLPGLSYLIFVEQSVLFCSSSSPFSSLPLSSWNFLVSIHHPKSYLEIVFKITGSILLV